VVLIPNFPLFRMMVLSQVVNGIVLPFILVFMIFLINRRDVMGEFTNGRIWNAVSWATAIGVILLSAMLGFSYL